MTMDAKSLTAAVKELNEANAAGKTDDVTRILTKFKEEVEPTEELLRVSRAGIAVGKLRQHATPAVSTLAKEIVKAWKDAVEESKRKRKRAAEDGSAGDLKRTKAEASTSASASPAAKGSPAQGAAGKEENGSTSPKSPAPLSTIEKRDKPRTAKDDGVANKLKAIDSDDSVRDKCVVMIYDALAGDSNASTTVITERAVAIEKEVYKLMKFNSGNEYRAKIRTLFLNLKDKGNPGLRNEIVLGNVTAEQVAKMTKEEMASESLRALKSEILESNLFKAKSAGEVQAQTDAFKCGRCGQRKTTYYQMQTRSADEPMTTFVSCVNCGNQWKFS